jgi:hypothetical protein
MANVEATEQQILIVMFLLLVLTNVGEGLRHVFLPLGMLMESVADFLLALFNYGEPGVDTSEVHRLLMAHGRWMMMMDHGSLTYGRGSPMPRRTYIPPECHWRSPRTPVIGSSRNSHAPTMH